MSDEHFGVFNSSESYTHHAVARRLGMADTKGRCSQFVLNRMLKDGLPFRKAGKFYLISGQCINLWIQEGSATWDAWSDDTKSSDDEDDQDSSADGSTNHQQRGVKKR